MNLKEILNKNTFTREEIKFLLGLQTEEDKKLLFSKADQKKNEVFGNVVHVRGLIEFSNYCSRHCMFCGLREENFTTPRYRMSADEIIDAARKTHNSGVRTVILQSGEDSYYDTDIISYIIYSIKREYDVAITLALGERQFDEYKAWKIAGADRYVLMHETSNAEQFEINHKGHKLGDRLNHISYLQRIGYQVASGNIVGLPNQTVEDLTEDIFLNKRLGVDTVMVLPFIPAKFTPYQMNLSSDYDTILKFTAVVRLVMPTSHIPTGWKFEHLSDEDCRNGLCAGANTLLANFTPEPYREMCYFYKFTHTPLDETFQQKKLRTNLEKAGLRISDTKGHAVKSVH